MKNSGSDVPVDVLGLILSKLYGPDALAFASVCRAWKSVLKQKLSDKELSTCSYPCLIFPNKRFFNPMHNMLFGHETTYPTPDADILAENYGWLLMAKRKDDPFFFFNPFTGERIDLPAAPLCFSRSVTFTAPPDSQDCEIICIRSEKQKRIIIQTIRRGEDEFNIVSDRLNVNERGFWMHGNYKIVYYRGEYYYMGKEGNLGIYNADTDEHRFTRSAKNLWPHFSAYDCVRFFFQGEGDLWAVFTANKGENICVCKLNLLKERWEKVHDLGDRMVFLSHKSCYMERAKVRGTSNKIYFPRLYGDSCLFYCLATKKYHTFGRGSTSFSNFENIRERVNCTWIKMDTEASSSVTCDEEFSW